MRLLLNLLVSRTISAKLKESKLIERLGVRGRRLDAQLACELAARFPPQLDEGAEGIGGRLQQHAGKAPLRAVRRQCAAENTTRSHCRRGHFEIDSGGRAAAAAGGEAHVIFDHQIDGRRTRDDIHPPRFGIGNDA